MTVDNLTRLVGAESAVMTLAKVPEFYYEISKVVLNKASDDIADADQVINFFVIMNSRQLIIAIY